MKDRCYLVTIKYSDGIQCPDGVCRTWADVVARFPGFTRAPAWNPVELGALSAPCPREYIIRYEDRITEGRISVLNWAEVGDHVDVLVRWLPFFG